MLEVLDPSPKQHKKRTEALLDELYALFGSTSSIELFAAVFAWYFVPKQNEHKAQVEAAFQKAHVQYLSTGTCPDFFEKVPVLYAKIKAEMDSPTHRRHLSQQPPKHTLSALQSAEL